MKSEKNKLFWLIGIATLVRIIVAISIDLGNDEVYYLTYAQHLQWNYFDHPPIVALLIRLTTINLFFTSEFFIRLGPILLAAINTYLIYCICNLIKNEKAGLLATFLFSSSFYSSIIAGVFILPDAPQLFFWILSIYLLLNIVLATEKTSNFNFRILIFGIIAGLCIMSKVHGVFLWIGFGLYILFYDRSLLSNKYLYFSIVFTLVIISPILIWNIENHFITYTFHSNRIIINNGLNPSSFLREFLGGFLYTNPINYFLIIVALIALGKNRITIAVPVKRLLLLLSLPLIVLLLFISLFRDTLPHWSGPAFVALTILTGCYFSEFIQDNTKFRLPRMIIVSCVLTLVLLFSGITLINYYPGAIGGGSNPNLLGQGDVTLDMYNWDFFTSEFKKIHNQNIKSKKTNSTFIINNKWFPGAHIDNYIAQPLHLDFVAVGKLEDIHTYAWLNNYRKKMEVGDDAYFITFSNYFTDPFELYSGKFQKINKPIVITQYRNKLPVRQMLVYLLETYKG